MTIRNYVICLVLSLVTVNISGQITPKCDSLKTLYIQFLKQPNDLSLKQSFIRNFPDDFKTFNQIYGIGGILEAVSYEHQDLYFELLSDSVLIGKEAVLHTFLKMAPGYINDVDFISNYSISSASFIYRNIKDTDINILLNPEERKQLIDFLGKTEYGMNKLILESYLKSELLVAHHKQIRQILKKWQPKSQ